MNDNIENNAPVVAPTNEADRLYELALTYDMQKAYDLYRDPS